MIGTRELSIVTGEPLQQINKRAIEAIGTGVARSTVDEELIINGDQLYILADTYKVETAEALINHRKLPENSTTEALLVISERLATLTIEVAQRSADEREAIRLVMELAYEGYAAEVLELLKTFKLETL